MKGTFKVSQAAREIGRSEKWLRLADAQGRIPKARRDFNNWRIYTEEDIEVIKSLLLPADEGGEARNK